MPDSRPGRHGLRRRLGLALTAISAVSAMLLALAFWAGEEWLEQRSLQELRRSAQQDQAISEADFLRHTSELAARRGLWVLLLMTGGAAVIGLGAWWASGRLARRSLEPLEQLVAQLGSVDLERRGTRIAPGPADAELVPITQALNTLLEQLDGLVERERAFAAAASHELRTPLNVIRGASDVLVQTGASAAPVGRIQRAVQDATQQLEALLTLSRQRESPQAEALRLDACLPQWAEPWVAEARAQDTRVEWTLAPAELRAPAGLLAIVFTNLLRNALAAARGGEVRIVLREGAIEIADDGPGLPEALARDPLQAFRGGAGGRTGMGLYIATELARRGGWRVGFAPRAPRGTVASIGFTA